MSGRRVWRAYPKEDGGVRLEMSGFSPDVFDVAPPCARRVVGWLLGLVVGLVLGGLLSWCLS